MKAIRILFQSAALLAAGAALPALADVKAGVDAWSRGDYKRAVAEWRSPADKGDADAMFNLAQAYRLGRGVTVDLAMAERLYDGAAKLGHLKAADNYGLLLFQQGRREQALPYVTNAADRGDPRAQYLLGIAYFNGDLVAKDWVRAYALLSLANSAGLPQAPAALRQMDEFIPLSERQDAQVLAAQLKTQADARRVSELAAADLGLGDGVSAASPQITPEPVRKPEKSPSVLAAEAAVEQARIATGGNPAEAGADFTRQSPGVTGQPPTERPQPRRAETARPVQPAPVRNGAEVATTGKWRVQLGAFSVDGSAERLWSRLSTRAELAGKRSYTVPSGRLTKLQAGGFASREAAEAACKSLRAPGQPCVAVLP